jgi:Cof subfamily protein (haloacid dehalogenase superfamily)
MAIRLLALDLDGTTLDAHGGLSDAVRDAVAAVQRRGIRVVLCTGRRFRTALPMARSLELSGPIVVNNGVVVKEIESGVTLHHDYLPSDLYAEILALMRGLGPPLVYVDAYHEQRDLVTERVDAAHPFPQDYLAANTQFYSVVEDLAVDRPHDVIMMSAMADEASLARLCERAVKELGDRVKTHALINKNYRGQILEILSSRSGKWPALERLAADEGIAPKEIAAVGDDRNDVEMIHQAGLGIAMGNAVEPAKRAASIVVRSNAEGGAVEALQQVLLQA